jgi:tripartite ATP-independent transporter DctM subunit
MSGMGIGLLIFAGLLVLLALRIHVGVGMLIGGAAGFLAMSEWNPSSLLFTLNHLAYARLSNYDLAVIPLFMLMGQFATNGGLSKALFKFAAAFLGHWRGGLAMAATGACAGFGAICGSSLATAATMGQVALPELKAHGYSGRLATGTLAAAGTLGIMIPPSVPLVIYAVLTQESIGKLFMAAVIPGRLHGGHQNCGHS